MYQYKKIFQTMYYIVVTAVFFSLCLPVVTKAETIEKEVYFYDGVVSTRYAGDDGGGGYVYTYTRIHNTDTFDISGLKAVYVEYYPGYAEGYYITRGGCSISVYDDEENLLWNQSLSTSGAWLQVKFPSGVEPKKGYIQFSGSINNMERFHPGAGGSYAPYMTQLKIREVPQTPHFSGFEAPSDLTAQNRFIDISSYNQGRIRKNIEKRPW